MSTPLALPAELTIYTLGELRPAWLAWLADPVQADADHATVDAAGVDQIDAAGAQLLLSLSQALARQHRALTLLNPSAALSQACTALGLHALLGGSEPTGAAA
jgi:anti-anti-sigma regulatory factor